MLSMFKDSLGIDMFQQRTATFFPWFHRVITPGLLLAFAAFGLPFNLFRNYSFKSEK
jgi:hypothetical protein